LTKGRILRLNLRYSTTPIVLPASTTCRYLGAYGAWGFATARFRRRCRRRRRRCHRSCCRCFSRRHRCFPPCCPPRRSPRNRKALPAIGSSSSEESISSSEEESTLSQEKWLSLLSSSSSWNRSRRSSLLVLGSSSSETTPKSNSSVSQCRGASASCAAVGLYSGVGCRLSEMGSREETEELEEEGERGEPMELEPEEEEIAMATGGLGALRCLAEGGRRVCGERS